MYVCYIIYWLYKIIITLYISTIYFKQKKKKLILTKLTDWEGKSLISFISIGAQCIPSIDSKTFAFSLLR